MAAARRRTVAALRRRFVTPEGVDLQLELAGAGERATAFAIDAAIMLATLIAVSVVLWVIGARSGAHDGSVDAVAVIWLLGFFVLRNGWFTLFELGGRGATPGKRLAGLRVVARDGKRLTGGAVIVRNAMREIELFLPLTYFGAEKIDGTGDRFLTIFMLAWTGIFLLFPLFNKDRLRVGDLLAGTWVVHNVRGTLAPDLGTAGTGERRFFSDKALNLYGIYELQTLEDVLRRDQGDAIATVAASIRRKAGIADDGDDRGFLNDYYAALCARLERGVMLGQRREDKFAGRR
jgi:uncharacterized RDD family membrane protein YckC